eukprot:1186395-Prorocentrum_minimum.AAC.1
MRRLRLSFEAGVHLFHRGSDFRREAEALCLRQWRQWCRIQRLKRLEGRSGGDWLVCRSEVLGSKAILSRLCANMGRERFVEPLTSHVTAEELKSAIPPPICLRIWQDGKSTLGRAKGIKEWVLQWVSQWVWHF